MTRRRRLARRALVLLGALLLAAAVVVVTQPLWAFGVLAWAYPGIVWRVETSRS